MIHRFASVLALYTALGLALAACQHADRVPTPEIAFEQAPVIRLEAERPIEIVEAYRAPLTRPNVEHEYGIVPAQIARAWVRDRVALSGNGGSVRLTIINASVLLETVPVETGLSGWFKNEIDRRLTGTLEVQFDFVGVNGSSASTRAKVAVTRGVSEKAHPNEVEAIYFEMLQDMARGFDKEMARQIDEAFQPVMRGAA